MDLRRQHQHPSEKIHGPRHPVRRKNVDVPRHDWHPSRRASHTRSHNTCRTPRPPSVTPRDRSNACPGPLGAPTLSGRMGSSCPLPEPPRHPKVVDVGSTNATLVLYNRLLMNCVFPSVTLLLRISPTMPVHSPTPPVPRHRTIHVNQPPELFRRGRPARFLLLQRKNPHGVLGTMRPPTRRRRPIPPLRCTARKGVCRTGERMPIPPGNKVKE